jgi:hypothetical protein
VKEKNGKKRDPVDLCPTQLKTRLKTTSRRCQILNSWPEKWLRINEISLAHKIILAERFLVYKIPTSLPQRLGWHHELVYHCGYKKDLILTV